MPLKSNLFQGSARLNACLVDHSQHVTPGQTGEHVADIQLALKHIDGLQISEAEIQSKTYGPSTAAAVLAYKKKRRVINRSYQSTEDNIVGKMTIASLDDEMFALQKRPRVGNSRFCSRGMCGCEVMKPGAMPPAEVPRSIFMAWGLDGKNSSSRV
jgi:hypothetical protein